MFPIAAATSQVAAHSKRKEKARIAARARRSQEANIILEMASELNIGQEKLRRIDKATIVKLAIDYIRAHDMLCKRDNHNISSSINSNIHNNNNNNKCPNEKANDEYQAEDEGQEAAKQETRQRLHEQQLELHLQLRQRQQQQQQHNQQQLQTRQLQQQQQQQQQLQKTRPQPLYPAPKLTTASIFAPKTQDNENSYFLMIEEKDNGKSSFVLKRDTEIQDEDDLTHLAPQAGDISISFETDPLDGIPLDDLLIP